MDISNEVQRIINTLSSLEIISTYENMDKLLGCMQLLENIRDAAKEGGNGNADAE